MSADEDPQVGGPEGRRRLDPDRLLRIARALDESGHVDWEDARRSNPELTGALAGLEALESIAAAYANPPESGPAAVDAPDLGIGQCLGRFRIEREAGRGGMGIVYRAQDEVLGRPVALKVLPPKFAGATQWLERLGREAKLLASLNHPGVATIHTMEQDAGGLLYLVLEWVNGETLEARLRRGPLTAREALETCAQIADALAAAHEGGVIHRDLKPGNVMILASGRIKVLDFGIARSRLEQRREDSPVEGTWGYLSPESLLGTEDHRADIYAFGCVLYECLTGRPAFPSRGPWPDGNHVAPTATAPDLDLLPEGTWPSIRGLIRGCLQPDPERRPASMRGVIEAIENALGRPSRPRPPVPPGIPRPATNFLGRDEEMGRGRALLADHRILILTGPGGCGKTRLAIALASDPWALGLTEAWFADLSAITDEERLLQEVATATGLVDTPPAPLFDRLRGHLGDGAALLVLDNCEHALGAATDLAHRLVKQCPRLRVLATSRIAAGPDDGVTLQVPPLPVPGPEEIADPDALRRNDSVRLFLERIGPSIGEIELDARAFASIAEICRRVEGLPLALELAAARAVALSPAEILERLDRPLSLLRRTSGHRDGRQSALRETIRWSVDLLSEDEARAFRRLSVFVNGWDLPAATRLLTSSGDEFEALDTITRLVENSLVGVIRVEGEASRYRFLESIRQFALEELARSGEEDEARGLHLLHFLDLTETSMAGLHGPDQGRWMNRLERDHENILASLDHCENVPRGTEYALRIGASIQRFWQGRGYVRVGQRALDRALGRVSADVPEAVHAKALYARGLLVLHVGRYSVLEGDPWEPQALRNLFLDALGRFRRLGDLRAVAGCLNAIGIEHNSHGDYPEGRAALAEACQLYRELGETSRLAGAANNLGLAAWLQRDLQAARLVIAESYDLARGQGDLRFEAIMSTNLAFLATRLNDLGAARRHLEEAVRLATELGDTAEPAIGAVLCAAELAEADGRDERSAWLFGAADTMLEKMGVRLTPDRPYWHEHDACVDRLASRLGRPRFETRRTAGRAALPEDVLRVALEG